MTTVASAAGSVSRVRMRRPGRPSRAALLYGVLGALLVLLCVGSAVAGQLDASPTEVMGTFLHRLGIDAVPRPASATVEEALWLVRFPRIALAVTVGAALGCAGAVMQGVFRNPLAEPGVVGVSAGSAVGAAIVLVTGMSSLGSWTLPAGAFVAGTLTTFLVYSMSRADGRTEVVTLVLTGIAVNAFAGAAIGLLTYVSDSVELRAVASFNLGSLAGSTWSAVVTVLPIAIVGVVVSVRSSRALDLLTLGEVPAGHLGVDVPRLTLRLITAVALLTASATAYTGIVAFVGLVAPHVVRLVAGPTHRNLVPLSGLLGAVMLVAADFAARTLVSPEELPLGVLTALVGAPFFLMLVRGARRSSGGWA